MKKRNNCIGLRVALCVALCAMILAACSTGEAMIEDAVPGTRSGGTAAQAPLFIACRPAAAGRVEFDFSTPVKVKNIRFSPELETASVTDGSTVIVTLTAGAAAGERIMADIIVEDEHGNTLNVLVPFRARNDRIPDLLINELRTERSVNADRTKFNVEFVEFVTREAGNLAALRLFIEGNTKQPLVYEFPSIEVKAGEYVVVHLRTEEEGAVNELGDNLDESGGTGSTPEARDLWIEGSVKLLRKTDAVYFLDQDDKALDAVMLSEKTGTYWTQTYFAGAAETLAAQGAWSGKGPDGAVRSGETTATRTINRDEKAADTNSAADWYVCETSGATPGKTNNPNRYVPKAK